VKQSHRDQSVQYTGDERNTGGHTKQGAPGAHGADRVSGSRAGNVNGKSSGNKP
jgi:hypothetical protein